MMDFYVIGLISGLFVGFGASTYWYLQRLTGIREQFQRLQERYG